MVVYNVQNLIRRSQDNLGRSLNSDAPNPICNCSCLQLQLLAIELLCWVYTFVIVSSLFLGRRGDGPGILGIVYRRGRGRVWLDLQSTRFPLPLCKCPLPRPNYVGEILKSCSIFITKFWARLVFVESIWVWVRVSGKALIGRRGWELMRN